MDPKQAPVQEVVTRVKMPLLVVGNRTGIRPRAAGAVVDDEEEDVEGEDGEGGDGEDDYNKQRGERDPDCNLQALVMMMTMLLTGMTMVMIMRKTMVMITMT